jgi:predicted transcriptional regulator
MVDNGYMDTKREMVHISIRFPREVAEALKRLAQEHDRSINGEVIRAVKEYIKRQQKSSREGDRA